MSLPPGGVLEPVPVGGFVGSIGGDCTTGAVTMATIVIVAVSGAPIE